MDKFSGWYTFALLVFLFSKTSDCFKLQDASIFPGLNVTGLRLPFTELGHFADIPKTLKDEGFLRMGLFCVKRGAFILYRQAQFLSKHGKDIKIASGENKCYNNMQGMQSAQPIGPIHLPKQDSITFYNNPMFGGAGVPTAKDVGLGFFSNMKKTIKSAILIGRQNWTIITQKGIKHCMRVKFDPKEKYPICLLPDLMHTNMKMPGVFLRKVRKGCKAEEVGSNIIEINNCQYWGGKVPRTKPKFTVWGKDVEKGRSDSDTQCAGDGSEEMKETIRLYKALLTNAFDDLIILEWKDIGKVTWKLELLDTIFEIAMAAVPGSLVPFYYMNRIRELFIYQLAKAWKRLGDDGSVTDGKIGLLTEYDYRSLAHLTRNCYGMMGVDGPLFQGIAENAWYRMAEPGQSENIVWRSLVRNKGNNIVIEMTWLLTNMVGGICHRLFGYVHNFWALYIHFITQMYLVPVVPEWSQKIPNLDILLGGDMNVKYNQLALFTSVSLDAANQLEPFKRPTAKTIGK
ncbi:unnamed protein product [Orchesella dallaii]|uniref:Uncharacterized protein n=1 Tax=Orchesella dallaii TaxID=48710 RepID=A0ABP1R7Z2_9HEXA